MTEHLQLFVSFFKVGLFTFGGGYAMLPILQREVVEKRGWATEEELLDCYAIGQCTPGVIAVNTATYIGFKRKNGLGSALATAAVVLPSLIIISLIAMFLRSFADNAYVQYAFLGIRIAVAVLVCDALIKLYKKGVKGAFSNGIFAVALLYSLLPDFFPVLGKFVSPVWVVLAAIVLGIILARREAHRK